MLSTLPLKSLLEAFRSSEPTPGGGSASALAGAVGASLLAMVAGLPKPRAATDADAARLAVARAACTAFAEKLTCLIDRDSDAYEMVLGAYRLPKGSDAEKEARSAEIQRALQAATQAPLDVMRTCSEALGRASVVAALGNRNASSDVQVALELLGAGLRGARLNVEINLGSLKDTAFVARARDDAERMAADAQSQIDNARRQLQEA